MKSPIYFIIAVLFCAVMQVKLAHGICAATPDSLPVMNFDTITDFSLTFDPWTVRDVGGGLTYGINGTSFLHSGDPMAFICFNPSKTSPPLHSMIPHSGKKLGACFSSMPPNIPNNKWLISPFVLIKPSQKIGFWVKTYDTTYGHEKFNVGVSTTGTNPANFTVISGSTPDSALDAWTYKEYSLANYTNQNVHVGIQCVSSDQYIFMIDDILISNSTGIDNESHASEVSVYPNPAKESLFINPGTVGHIRSVELISNMGSVMRTIFPGKDERIISFELAGTSSGMYFVRIVSDQVIIKKIIINQ